MFRHVVSVLVIGVAFLFVVVPADVAAKTFDVTRYGAKGNGVANDTDAIRKAIDAAAQSGGGTIFFPRGTYMVGKGSQKGNGVWIEKKRNLIFQGTGRGSVIKLLSNQGSFARGMSIKYSSNITVRNLSFHGNKQNNAKTEHQHGIFNWGSSNVTIDNVWSRYWWGDAIYAGFTDSGGTASNVVVKNSTTYSSGRMGIDITGGHTIRIQNNKTYYDGGSFAMKIEQENPTLRDITITGNLISGSSLGVVLSNKAKRAHRITITNNKVISARPRFGGIYLHRLIDGTVRNNTIEKASNFGIELDETTKARIEGNTVTRSLGGVKEGSKSTGNTVINNVFQNNKLKSISRAGSVWRNNREGSQARSTSRSSSSSSSSSVSSRSIRVSAGPNLTVKPGETVALRGTASGSRLTYRWKCFTGDISAPNSLRTEYTAPESIPSSVQGNWKFGCSVTATNSSGASRKDNLTVTVLNTQQATTQSVQRSSRSSSRNRAPWVSSLRDVRVRAGNTITFAAAASDPDRDTLQYQWRCFSGALSASTNLRTKYTAPKNIPASVRGNWKFGCSLTATDSRGKSTKRQFFVTVLPSNTSGSSNTGPSGNRRPSVSAGADVRIKPGGVTTFRGSGSDADRDRFTYQWRCFDGDVSTPRRARTKYTAPNTIPASVQGDWTFGCSLTVTDEHGASKKDQKLVTVLQP